MNSVRRRRGGGDDNELRESLLSADEHPSSSGAAQQQQQPSSSRALILHTPFSVDSFIQWVVQSWLAFMGTLSSCLQSLLRVGLGGGVSLSLVQAERLEELQERLAVPYDGGSLQHQQQLLELWALAFPDSPAPPRGNIKAERWKDMGWQSDDPGRDFRGAGLFGLDNLLYLGTHQPELFRALLAKSRGSRSHWEYPFACGGLNLTFQVAEVLGIHGTNPGQTPTTAAGRAFCELLRESDAAFEEVYCAAFDLLDRVWLERRASYMEFNQVMKDVKASLDAALRKRPTSIKELRATLLAGRS